MFLCTKARKCPRGITVACAVSVVSFLYQLVSNYDLFSGRGGRRCWPGPGHNNVTAVTIISADIQLAAFIIHPDFLLRYPKIEAF